MFIQSPDYSAFVDRWLIDRDPLEALAIAECEAQMAYHEDAMLREEQWAALESECRWRGIIPEDLDADPLAIPGMTRVDFESVEGCDDGEDRCDEWPDPDEG